MYAGDDMMMPTMTPNSPKALPKICRQQTASQEIRSTKILAIPAFKKWLLIKMRIQRIA
jgi:hypothetical protein